MGNPYLEWITQAEYDIDSADYMFKGGRYIYTIFLCHLSVEKALKAFYSKNKEAVPPKTHNLLFLVEKFGDILLLV